MTHSFFRNRVAVVTGAGSGMGRQLAIRLSNQGCHMAISDIDEEGLSATASAIQGTVYTDIFDVSDRDAFNKHAETITRKFGQVDILINNAGVGLSGQLMETTPEDFEWVMNINFWGVVNGTRAFLPEMLKRKSGTIVNMSSALGIIALPAQTAYCASKFAVRGFTESMRQEMVINKTGVNMICVHPGVVKTGIARNSRFYSDPFGRRNRSRMVEEFETMPGVAPETAAACIVRAIARAQPRVLIGTDARFMEWVQRLRPVYYSRTLKFVDGLLRNRRQHDTHELVQRSAAE